MCRNKFTLLGITYYKSRNDRTKARVRNSPITNYQITYLCSHPVGRRCAPTQPECPGGYTGPPGACAKPRCSSLEFPSLFWGFSGSWCWCYSFWDDARCPPMPGASFLLASAAGVVSGLWRGPCSSFFQRLS